MTANVGHFNHIFQDRNYSVFAGSGYEDLAKRLQDYQPNRFQYFETLYEKFPDGTDNITLAGYSPTNKIAGTHVLFLASLMSNDSTLSQFSVLIVLLQSFIQSLTIVLPFYPVGTNERVDVEGKVATANTYAMLFSSLPSCGQPSRLMIYDIHALQERFYFHGSIIPSIHSALPLLLPRLEARNITAVAFPDDGAAKRFGHFFRKLGYEIIVCGKVRIGTKRIVTIQDGEPTGKRVVIVDDLAQSGGTLYEAGLQLKKHGALEVYAYVTHAVFPGESWRRFLYSQAQVDDIKQATAAAATAAPTPFSSPAPPPSSTLQQQQSVDGIPPLSLPASAVLTNEHNAILGHSTQTIVDPQLPTSSTVERKRGDVLFEKFWMTNSIPHTMERVPSDDVFEIIDLLPQIIHDLEFRMN